MSVRVVCCTVFGKDECGTEKAVKLSVDDVDKKLKEGFAVYEVLQANDKRRIYLDVENVFKKPEELEPFIIKLIEDFKKEFCLVAAVARVTVNVHSRHPGYSFHIIFNRYVVGYRVLRNMTRFFLDHHPEYKGMVDPLVSNPCQYFRVPFSHNGLSKIKYSGDALHCDCKRTTRWIETSRRIRDDVHIEAAEDDFHCPIDESEYNDVPYSFYVTNIIGASLYHNVFPQYNWAIDQRLAKNMFGIIVSNGNETGSQTSRTTSSMAVHFQPNQNGNADVHVVGTE